MLNEQQFKSKWTEIKGGLRNLWGRLTDEELELTKGSLTSIAQLVDKKYGETKDEIRMKLKTLITSFDNPTDKGVSPDESSFERTPQGITTEVSQNQEQDSVAKASAYKTSISKDGSNDRIARH